MANANEKIIIQEINESSPMGAGASSDVAYVPGITCGNMKNANRPILCNTVDELINYFGRAYDGADEVITKTKEFTFGSHKVLGNLPDPSYIYAKELLNAGMSVYYEAIVVTPDTLTDIDEELADLGVKAGEAEAALAAAQSKLAAENEKGKDPAIINALTKEIKALNEQLAVYEAKEASLTKRKTLTGVEYLYECLADRYDVLTDKSEYTVKYITSGGYPTFTNYSETADGIINPIATAQLAAAAKRGDAVALIDHGDNGTKPLGATNSKSIYRAVNESNWTDGSFGAMFTPWATYVCPLEGKVELPASFGYLMCMAKAIKTSPNWLAMAGIARGQVPYIQALSTKQTLTNVIAEDYQPRYGATNHNISVNAITNIKPYGLTIWGNRTMEKVSDKGTTALALLNARNMVSDVKKVAYSTAKSLMFEQDGDVLWNKFKSGISPLLDQMKAGYGISNYAIIRNKTKFNGKQLDRGEVSATIRIYPIAAVEYFEITVAVADEDVSVS